MKHLLSLAAMLVAVGCGPAEAQISDGVIKLGVLNDMSSLYADIGGKGSVLAAQMAADDFGGNIPGARVEIVSADHQNKPDIGGGIARRWIDVDHVDAIVDPLVPNEVTSLPCLERSAFFVGVRSRSFAFTFPRSAGCTKHFRPMRPCCCAAGWG